MTKTERLSFELCVMNLAEKCKTEEDYELLSKELHESVENALLDMSMDNGINDYYPCYY